MTCTTATQTVYLVTIFARSLDEINILEKVHPLCSMARLALALALYTDLRRSVLVRFGWQDLWGNSQDVLWLTFTQHKGRSRHPIDLEIPVIPELRHHLTADQVGDGRFLITK